VEERTLRETFEYLAVSVAQLNLYCNLLSANEQMCELIANRRETCWRKISMICSRNPGLSAGSAWTTGEIHHYSTNLSAVRTDGQLVWVEMVFSLVRDDVTKMPRSLTAGTKISSVLSAPSGSCTTPR
jgi:hypothetical protein